MRDFLIKTYSEEGQIVLSMNSEDKYDRCDKGSRLSQPTITPFLASRRRSNCIAHVLLQTLQMLLPSGVI